MLPLTLEPAITGRKLSAKKKMNEIKINNSSKGPGICDLPGSRRKALMQKAPESPQLPMDLPAQQGRF